MILHDYLLLILAYCVACGLSVWLASRILP